MDSTGDINMYNTDRTDPGVQAIVALSQFTAAADAPQPPTAAAAATAGPSTIDDSLKDLSTFFSLKAEEAIKSEDAYTNFIELTPLGVNTEGRGDAKTQLRPTYRLAQWILNHSKSCQPPLRQQIVHAAKRFLERWSPIDPVPANKGLIETLSKNQHSGYGKCWICGQPIQPGDCWEIEHILGMRPSASMFTPLATSATFKSLGLNYQSYVKLMNGLPHKFNNPHIMNPNDKEIHDLLCQLKWKCNYNFLNNYAPAHECCNKIKGTFELAKNYLTNAEGYFASYNINGEQFNVQRVRHTINMPAIIELLTKIQDRVKEAKQTGAATEAMVYVRKAKSPKTVAAAKKKATTKKKACNVTGNNCIQLLKYKDSILTNTFINTQAQKIADNYLQPLIEANDNDPECIPGPEGQGIGMLSELAVMRDARRQSDIDSLNKQYEQLIQSHGDPDLPGLPWQAPISDIYIGKVDITALATEMGIPLDILTQKLEQPNTDADVFTDDQKKIIKEFQQKRKHIIDGRKPKKTKTGGRFTKKNKKSKKHKNFKKHKKTKKI